MLPHYRLYVLAKLPQLRTLDFEKVTMKERMQAREMFGEQKGQQLAEEIKKQQMENLKKRGMTKEDKLRKEKALQLKMRIENAESLEEIMKIEEEMKKGEYDQLLLDEE